MQVGVGAAAISAAGCGSTPPVECVVSEYGPYSVGGKNPVVIPNPVVPGQSFTINPLLASHTIANLVGFTRYVVDLEPGVTPTGDYQLFMLESHLSASKPKLHVTYTVPVAEVVASTMQGSVTSNPDPSLMTLQFRFDGTVTAEQFEVQFRVAGGAWTTLTCSAPSASCIFSGLTSEALGTAACQVAKVTWKARIFDDCVGWGPWSGTKTFNVACVE